MYSVNTTYALMGFFSEKKKKIILKIQKLPYHDYKLFSFPTLSHVLFFGSSWCDLPHQCDTNLSPLGQNTKDKIKDNAVVSFLKFSGCHG